VVKFVEPPAGSKPGDRVTFEGLPIVPPASAAQIGKKKIAETVHTRPREQMARNARQQKQRCIA
jgi:hypothetical protein